MLNGKVLNMPLPPASMAGTITSVRTFDANILRQFYHNPDIWGPTQCDGGLDAEDLDFDEILADESSGAHVFVISKIDGDVAALFMFAMENTRCYSIHSALLPEYWGHGFAPALGLAACYWIFDNTDCLKVITLVPDFNSGALEMAMSAGMLIEGVNRASFMKNGTLYDQTMLGFTKEELLCQSPQF